ncbi:TNF receptor-associated factor 2-like [Saccoglossus kowalevskii]|uniref:TNF receptor-associated factor 2-like n=1 Tax=Saccoglossus kowalevskii TaxID=10224 RepID=A0ABM0H089_SACKO|nr:PREDICTED: TNF receptor-associated factor 2-like [Saccoglossus kowalevskii]
MAGYLFLEPLTPKYLCTLCKQVLRDPVQTTCGHRYCRSCIDDFINRPGTQRCFECAGEDDPDNIITADQIFPDNATKREIQCLEVKCSLPSCTWKGSFKDYEERGHNGHVMVGSADQDGATQIDPDVPTTSQKIKTETAQKVGREEVKSTSGMHTTINKQSRSIDELKVKTATLNTEVSKYERIVAGLYRQIERNANDVQAIERKLKQDRDLVESLERKIKFQDRIIALKDVALAEQDLRIQSLELASYDGVLVWKITDFNRKRNDALSGRTTSIYSPCFFTSCHGYKMCARVYLNGDGMGKGNHISLFFVIMRGSFDALLRWPFRQKVTFMIMDQNNQEHVIDAFRPDPTSNSFKRPTGDMNIASGCPLFMPLSQLDSSRHAYVKDDCMFIKVIVDTTDLDMKWLL